MSGPICSVEGLAEHPWGGGDLEWELGGTQSSPIPGISPERAVLMALGTSPGSSLRDDPGVPLPLVRESL